MIISIKVCGFIFLFFSSPGSLSSVEDDTGEAVVALASEGGGRACPGEERLSDVVVAILPGCQRLFVEDYLSQYIHNTRLPAVVCLLLLLRVIIIRGRKR